MGQNKREGDERDYNEEVPQLQGGKIICLHLRSNRVILPALFENHIECLHEPARKEIFGCAHQRKRRKQ